MLNNRDVVDYVNGDYALSNNRLFALGENFSWNLVENAEKLETLQSELADFNTVSRFAVQYDHLKPLEASVELLRVVESKTQYEIGPDKKYGWLFDDFMLSDNYEDVFVDLSFDLQSLDTASPMPLVVVKLDSYYMSLRLNSSEDVSLNTGDEEHYYYHLNAPLLEDSQGKLLKIYLYNNSGGAMRYGNIKIQVSGVRKS